jgi:hypothetical protein
MTNTLDSATLTQVNALNNQGQYAEAYQLIADKLLDALPTTAPSSIEGAGKLIADFNQAAWFYSASQVNSDSGFISGFIRGYANNADFPSQKLQDFFTKEQLDAASDAVAQKVLEEIIKQNGEIPPVDKLLEIDRDTVTQNLKIDPGQWPGAVVGGFIPGFDAPDVQNPIDFQMRVSATIAGVLSALDRIRHSAAEFISEKVWDFFHDAQAWTPPRRDPLALDLDNDGIETIVINGWNGVLFDNNNDGIKTGTGWLSGDDGFLVLDKNGNGTIDNGNELFGDNTKLSNGLVATDGFAALADLDSNQDGMMNASDTVFANLRVWQDLNQDGISQANELKSLDELGITSLSTTGAAFGQTQNGNIISLSSSYTNSDGTATQTANLLLSSSTFHTEFTDPIATSATDLARPDVHGSGQVRNLRDAAAMSPALAVTLDSYSVATTKEQQMTQLDDLLKLWSQTSTLQGSVAKAFEHQFLLKFTFGSLAQASTVNSFQATTASSGCGGSAAAVFNLLDWFDNQTTEYQAWANKLLLLERFNGTESISLAYQGSCFS